MLSDPFQQRAFLAGGLIALSAGLVGYFVVLRSQVFTGDALSHVATAGALGALAVGVDLRIGLFGCCLAFGLAMAALGRRGRADDVVVGSVFAWILGLGALFLTVYTTNHSGGNSSAGVTVLFGSIFGLSASEALLAEGLALAVALVLVALARPLLFATLDDAVAAARGVPVRLLGFAFLALVAVTAGEATQAVGSLLLLGLLAAPAGAAHRLTDRPFRALWLSGAISLGSLWAGLTLAFAVPTLPPSFAIMSFASGSYLLALPLSHLRRRPSPPAPGIGPTTPLGSTR